MSRAMIDHLRTANKPAVAIPFGSFFIEGKVSGNVTEEGIMTLKDVRMRDSRGELLSVQADKATVNIRLLPIVVELHGGSFYDTEGLRNE
jgi:hypothetical protein